jgi:competence ComEA-like helix-hairpin-helix protein
MEPQSVDSGPPRNRFAIPLALLVLILSAIIAWRLHSGWQPMVPGATTAPSQLKLDPNTATWQELTCLPEIGESTAKRIVSYRERQRGQAFRSPADLDAVPGIGPRTVEEIAPYLTFPSR